MNEKRRLIIRATVALGFVASGTTYYLFQKEEEPDDLIKRRLKNLVVPIGLLDIAKQFPNAEQTLLQRFGEKNISESVFIELIKDAISDDYRQGNWQSIHQWLLSYTECLLIAAYIHVIGIIQQQIQQKTFDNAPFEDFLIVNNWGPRETHQGVKFNEQPDGHCGIWAQIENMPDGMRVFIGGKERNLFFNEKGFTSGIYDEVEDFINRVGLSEIVIYDEINHRKQKIGDFEVLPPFDFYQFPDGRSSQVFGPVRKWGPNPVNIGDVFNKQPNGQAAFWFRIDSMSNQIRMIFNGESFKATVRKGLITSSLSSDYLPTKPGMYEVKLQDLVTDEVILVGELQVLSQKTQ